MIVLNKPHSVDKRLVFYMIHYIATINVVVATCKLLASFFSFLSLSWFHGTVRICFIHILLWTISLKILSEPLYLNVQLQQFVHYYY